MHVALRPARRWASLLLAAVFALALVPTTQAAVWTVQNGQILRDGQPYKVYGINWFGMETGTRAPHGLWTGRSLGSFLDQIKSLGFNTIRLPLSPETIYGGYPVDPYASGYASTGRQMLNVVLSEARARGLNVLLDLHRIDPNNDNLPGTWAVNGYSRADWVNVLRELARISTNHGNVIGIDLLNEPHALTWSTWQSAAREAGAAVNAINPNVLIFVEGVGNASANGGYGANWGGNLYEAGALSGIPANKLVYSPHAYGPSVAAQSYFNAGNFPANMPAIWDTHFGRLAQNGYAMVPGEFGGTMGGKDATWQYAFADYIVARNMAGYFYWCLNPNSGDTGGVLQNDWQTPVQSKVDLLNNLKSRLQPASATRTIRVRMKGRNAEERVRVTVGGQEVYTWRMRTWYRTLTANTNASGTIRVQFLNDAPGRDVQVDWLEIDGQRRQAENQAINTGAWDGTCGGGQYSEWLHCNGYIEFGRTPGAREMLPDDLAEAEQLRAEPVQTGLAAPFPNPASDRVTLAVDVAEAEAVRLTVVDVLGREVAVLADGALGQGQHVFDWETADVPPGLYLARFESASGLDVRRFTVVR